MGDGEDGLMGVPGETVESNYQIEWWRDADTILLTGAGTSYHLESIEGLAIPDSRYNDFDRQMDDGVFPPLSEPLGPRMIRGKYLIKPGASTLRAVKDDLVKIFRPATGNIQMSFQMPDYPVMTIVGRPRRLEWDIVANRHLGSVPVMFEFIGVDSVLYSNAESSVAFSIANTATDDSETVIPDGTYLSPPVVVINGPATNPKIINQDYDNRFVGVIYAMDSDDELIIDFKEKTILLNDVDRYDLIDPLSSWWKLLPQEQVIQYQRDSTAGASTATLTYKDAWAGI